MSFPKWILAGIMFCCIIVPFSGYCAQSTADVSASKELKDKARKDILGAKSKDITQSEDYVIGIGDLLSVSVFGEGDMAAPSAAGNAGAANPAGGAAASHMASVEVRLDGDISLKHIGDVKAAGMTLNQLADYLKKLYAPIFDDPTVTTVLVRSNSSKYSVMGKVIKSGVFPLTVEISLVEAIARCDGFSEWANRHVTVIRKDVREQDKDKFKNNTLDFDYDDFLKGKNLQNNINVQTGDVIVAH
jgi:polysaccharide biosynthesis/export protein